MKKFTVRVILFSALMAALQFIVATNREFKMLDKVTRSIKERDQVFFFGSSVDFFTGESDTDKRAISEMLAHSLPDLKIARLSHAAYQLDIFACLVQFVLARHLPEALIVEINPRSFSPGWHRRPTWQFTREKTVLEYYSFRALLYAFWNFKHYAAISEQEFSRTPVFKWDEQVGTVKDFGFHEEEPTPETTAAMLIFHYLYKLTPEHPKLSALRRLIERAQKSETRLLLFIPPLDWQTGEKYHPGEFRKITAANITLIKAIIEPYGIDVLDMSHALGTEFFSYRRFPNEHLTQGGRAFVADKLSAWLLSRPDTAKPQVKDKP